MTGNIINQGNNVFIPIMDKLGNIASEFIPYMIYIAIACLGISLAFTAVKYILGYLKNKSQNAIMDERKTREEDERRNKQNPYYSKSYDKPQNIKFGQWGYNSRRN